MTLQACAELVASSDPLRFASAMTGSIVAREVLFPLYAFNCEIARAPWMSEEAMIAEMRLQFWRDTVEEICAGKPPRAHEVAAPLAKVINQYDINADVLDEMILARRWNIYKDPFNDQAAFDQHIDQTSGHLMWTAAKALGAHDTDEVAIRAVAYASGVANWLVAIPDLVARKRIPLLDGRPEGVQDLARDALNRLSHGSKRRFSADVAAVLRSGWCAPAILKQVLKEPDRVSQGSLGQSEFAQKFRLMQLTLRGKYL
ncbi:squalene/phytoene synthase family protein [Cochlodiniinecator piscidefendens]|uniref:squalene/phytoene synthase family protein n=1 Tax=Cochlodiniinecator piscidefendens TaxID=2715756 RepID=UPI00140A60E3|nr:squalene/phytoene synthase family protein [Cochlodiniinecator piscidefendens]